MTHKILIGADICPTKSNMDAFIKGDVDSLIDEKLKNLLSSADFTIFNLEVPLVDRPTPITKCGPNLIAPTATINGLKAINSHFFTLANNHIMDQGEEGLKSTIAALDKAGIAHTGVGNTPEEAAKPYILTLDSKKIGIHCCAEHEFSIVTDDTPGANPFDPLESPDHIAELKKQCDYVIVLYHGGKEQFRYPSPNLQKTFRKLAEKGADLVIAQHTHCIGCQETYKGGTLVYGQGNFLFDMVDNDYWNSSVLIEVEFNDENSKVSFIPLIKENHMIKVAKEKEKSQILQGFEKRSKEIIEPGFVKDNYEKFAKSSIDGYLGGLYGKKNKTFMTKVLDKLSKGNYRRHLVKKNYGQEEITAIENVIECEAHRELLLNGLKGKRKCKK